jgi:hypothetical protein
MKRPRSAAFLRRISARCRFDRLVPFGAPRNDGGAIQHEVKLHKQLYSGLMFAALMIGHHFSISAL